MEVVNLPIIVKAKKNSSTSDLIKKFKKMVAASNVVQNAKDRRYFKKPSRVKADNTASHNRLRKRMHSLKRMKNTPEQVIERITQRLNS